MCPTANYDMITQIVPMICDNHRIIKHRYHKGNLMHSRSSIKDICASRIDQSHSLCLRSAADVTIDYISHSDCDCHLKNDINGSVQDCNTPIANVLEMLQSCTKPAISDSLDSDFIHGDMGHVKIYIFHSAQNIVRSFSFHCIKRRQLLPINNVIILTLSQCTLAGPVYTGMPLVDPVYTGIPLGHPANTCRVHWNTTGKT